MLHDDCGHRASHFDRTISAHRLRSEVVCHPPPPHHTKPTSLTPEILRHGKHANAGDNANSSRHQAKAAVPPPPPTQHRSAPEPAKAAPPPEQAEPSRDTYKQTAGATKNYREEAERIVAEEKAQGERMPSYDGLEDYTLVEKMGDGAFSNVYKAIEKKTGRKVAVKVVRKYELNHSQVSNESFVVLSSLASTDTRTDLARAATSTSTQTLRRGRVSQRLVSVSVGTHTHPSCGYGVVFVRESVSNSAQRANILKEVQIMRGIDHPGIVQLLQFFESDEHYFLVLECEFGLCDQGPAANPQ